MFEYGDWEDIIVPLFAFLAIFTLVCVCIQLAFIEPYQAEDAKQQCLAMGSPTYLEYQGILFSPKAMGVKCEYPQTTSNINLNNLNPLIEIKQTP